MKLFSAIIGLFFAVSLFAQTRKDIQNFYLAADQQWSIEGRYSSANGKEEFTNGTEIDVDTTTLTGKVLHGTWGKVLNLGGEINYLNQDGEADGLGDWELYARGRLETYLYEFRYFFSPDDQENDNAVSGGSHFWLKAGLFKNGWGFLGTFQPEYEADQLGNDDVEVGQETILEAFYEHLTPDNNTLAASIGSHHFNRGDLDDEDITEMFYRLYATFPFGGYDWMPEFKHSSLFNDSDDVDEKKVTTISFGVRTDF
ncbi:MAG: hypothetical protein KC478_03135 [Bacteriovoracaceae bacterium]|nr:hypothetical protein [Bacteriovoracaceae bacterium]